MKTMKQMTVALLALLFSAPAAFGYVYTKFKSSDVGFDFNRVYRWTEADTFTSMPTGTVNDAYYSSNSTSGGSFTRILMPANFWVDFTAFGMGQWSCQTSILHMAENAYLGVRSGSLTLAPTAKSYAELHLTNATLAVHSATTAYMTQMAGKNNAVALVDLQKGSVLSNGTGGTLQVAAGDSGQRVAINVEDSAVFGPYGSYTLGNGNQKSLAISLKNSRWESFPNGISVGTGASVSFSGDFTLSLDNSVFARESPNVSSLPTDWRVVCAASKKGVIELRNGSVLDWRRRAGTSNDSGMDLGPIGTFSLLVENSSITNSSLQFAGDTRSGAYGETAQLVFRGKSSFILTGNSDVMAANYRQGAEMHFEGGALDLRLAPAAPNLRLDWLYMTNGCSTVYVPVNDSGLSSSFSFRPQGGLQVVHTNAFCLFRFRPETKKKGVGGSGPVYGVATDVGDDGLVLRKKLAGDLFYQGENNSTKLNYALAAQGTPDATNLYGIVFRSTAELPFGETFAAKARGYFKLPPLALDRMKSVALRLAVTPQGTNTLAGLAAGLTGAGYAAQVVDADGCNLEADVPLSLLRNQSAAGKVWFDFTRAVTFDDAKNMNVTTNALLSKAVFVPKRKKGGLLISIR